MTADALITLLVAFLILIVFYGPWQDLCADYARQYAFEQRDALFDFAADGHVSFSSKEYRDARRSIENVIRFAHDLTIPRLIYLSMAHAGDQGSSSFRSLSIAAIPTEVKADLGTRLFKTYKGLIMMMVARSLPLLLLLPLVLILVAVAFVFSVVKDKLVFVIKRAGEHIQSEANYVER